MGIKFKFLIFLFASFFLIFSCTKTEEKPDVVIDIIVSKEGYNPSYIEVPKNKVVLFRIKAIDEGIGNNYTQKYYGHCFYIVPPYDIMVENIKKGETKSVKVRMVYPGRYILNMFTM